MLTRPADTPPCAAWAIGIAVIVAVLPLWLVPGVAAYFDWPLHLFWIQEFSRAVGQGTAYPRWIAAANGGYGAPTFVFYGPLAYWLAAAATACGASALTALKLVYTTAVAVGAFAAWRWYRVFGGTAAAMPAAAAILSPPLLMLIYRYNLPAAALATALSPLVLLGAWSARRGAGVAAIGVPFACVLLAHLPSALMLGVALALLALPDLASAEGRRRIVTIAAGLGLGFALAAFYWLPALWELRYVHAEALLGGALDWRRNLLFDPSIDSLHRARGDGLYLEATALTLAAALAAAWVFVERSASATSSDRAAIRRLGVAAFVLLALATPLGTAFYRYVPGAAQLQFGWRWLPLFALVAGAAIALAVRHAGPASRLAAVALASLPPAAFALSLPLVCGGGIVLPPVARTTPAQIAWALEAPRLDPPEHVPRAAPLGLMRNSGPAWTTLRGEATVTLLEDRDERRVWDVRAADEATVRVKTLCFPGWAIEVDGAEVATSCDRIGALLFQLPAGDHRGVQAFRSTVDRLVATWISLCALLALVVLVVMEARCPRLRHRE
ncbi:6-pyruvoyl-tetrahydropterin synthase-related protein [Dokdonella sp.]|uniref:6-pyruvoyl-tetrahydropterin synthase-related protein n=1 Tax=Dokdonella sp. TaxID=2291710 RepID=UPI001B215BD5|nr:6-pyruvoyl-tetrahydropterin synthase-related protein [Dokdonella sp.]MBO9664193.1 hypothetical protein [Dokdonella sp.]